jgi:hypothetical protein
MKINKIGNVLSYYYLQHKDDKEMNIYLFGDLHTPLYARCSLFDRNCVEIDEFFHVLFSQNKKEQFDFFIEDFYSNKDNNKNYTGFSTINRVRNRFNKCLKKDKITCPEEYLNTHFHYSDIRKNIPDKYNYSIIDIVNDILENKKLDLTIFNISSYQDIYKLILSYLDLPLLNKQIDKLDEPYQSKLKEYIERIKNHYNFTQNDGKIFENYQNFFSDISKKQLNNNIYIDKLVLLVFLQSSKHIMDVYLLSRLLRTFKDRKTNQKEPNRQKIIYAGHAHIESYVHFLIRNNFNIIETNMTTPTNTETLNGSVIYIQNNKNVDFKIDKTYIISSFKYDTNELHLLTQYDIFVSKKMYIHYLINLNTLNKIQSNYINRHIKTQKFMIDMSKLSFIYSKKEYSDTIRHNIVAICTILLIISSLLVLIFNFNDIKVKYHRKQKEIKISP